MPRVERVTGAQVRREALAELDRRYPPARRAADEEVLVLLGLLAPGVDLRSVAGSLFGEQVAGFYDPRKGRLAVVEGSEGGGAPFVEITLAHELVHALEDQRFGLEEDESFGLDDRALARTALYEGTATAAMTDYAQRHPGSVSLGDALGGLLGSAGGTGLPPYVEAVSLFPYLRGMELVNTVRRTGGWELVDTAFARPPSSSEQVLHPEKYLRVEEPDRVRLGVAPLLGPGWRRVAAGTLGEFDTAQILGRGGGRDRDTAAAAAAGWGGGAYELWRAGPLPDPRCPAPCRRRDALVAGWSWDTGDDAREAERALRAYAARRPGPARVLRRGRTTTLALAPTPALAQRLAASAIVRVDRG